MTTETEALKREIEGLSKFRQTRRYSPELQTRVTAWARARRAEGVSVPAMCLEIGIGDPTLRRFLGPTKKVAAKTPAVGFRRVKVVAPVATQVVVHGPCGISVEGLSLDGVAELVKRLACSV
jgi:transposase